MECNGDGQNARHSPQHTEVQDGPPRDPGARQEDSRELRRNERPKPRKNLSVAAKKLAALPHCIFHKKLRIASNARGEAQVVGRATLSASSLALTADRSQDSQISQQIQRSPHIQTRG